MATHDHTTTTTAAKWDEALAEYQRTSAEFDRLWKLYEDASEAHSRDCPREDRFFDEHRLGIGMSRERVIEQLRHNRWLKGKEGDEATLRQIADDFMAYQERNRASKDRHNVDEMEERASAYGEAHYFPAREALVAVAAPDTDALLIKLEVATASLSEEYMESALADARRLLGRA